MLCKEAKQAMAFLFDSPDRLNVYVQLSKDVEDAKSLLSINPDSIYYGTLLDNRQRQLNVATSLGMLKDPGLKGDLIQAMKNTGAGSKKILDIIESLETNSSKLSSYTKNFKGNKLSPKIISDALDKYIANDHAYSKAFNNFKKPKIATLVKEERYLKEGYTLLEDGKVKGPKKIYDSVEETPANAFNKKKSNRYYEKKIKTLYPDSNINYYTVYSNVFKGDNLFSMENVFNALEKNSGTMPHLDKETLFNNLLATKTSEELESLLAYNLQSFKGNKDLQSLLQDKFIEIFTDLDQQDTQVFKSILKEYEEITQNSLGNGIGIGGIMSRLKIARGAKAAKGVDIGKMANSMYSFLSKGELNSVYTIPGTSHTFTKQEVIRILGPQEIVKMSRKYKKNPLEAVEILSDALDIVDDSDRIRIVDAVIRGEASELNNIVSKGKDINLVNEAPTEGLIKSMTRSDADLTKKSVFYDFQYDVYKGASDDARKYNDYYEANHNSNAIDTELEVDYYNSYTQLGEALKKDKDIVNVFVPHVNAKSYPELQKMILEVNRTREAPVNVIAADFGFQNFSFGHIKDDAGHRLTLRARDESRFNEIVDNLSLAGYGHKKIAFDGDIPLLEDVSSKALGLNTFHKTIVDLETEYDKTKSLGKEGIITKVREYFTSRGYDVKTLDYNNLDDDTLVDMYHTFNVTTGKDVDEIIENKLKAINALKQYIGITGGKRVLNHFALTAAIDSIEKGLYTIPRGYEKFLNEYMATGQFDKDFLINFGKSNNKRLIDEAATAADVLQGSVQAANKKLAGVGVDYTPTPRIGDGPTPVIKNGEFGMLDQYKQGLISQETSYEEGVKVFKRGDGSIKFNKEQLLTEGNKIADDFFDEMSKAIGPDSKLTLQEKQDIVEKFYQRVDKFEYKNDLDYGELFSNSEKSSTIYGSKYNFGPVATPDDLRLLKSNVEQYKLDLARRVDGIQKRITDISSEDGFAKVGKKLINRNGDSVVLDLSDVIIAEAKNLDDASEFASFKYTTKGRLNKLTKHQKIEILDKIRADNIETLVGKGFVRNINYAKSVLLKDVGFFENYKLVDNGYGVKLPEALLDNTTYLPHITSDIDNVFKQTIMKNITKIVGNNTNNIVKNEAKLIDYVAKEVRSVIDDMINNGNLSNAEKLTLNDSYNHLVKSYSQDFRPYSHLTPVSSDSIEKVRRSFKTNKSPTYNEYESYFDFNENATTFLQNNNYKEEVSQGFAKILEDIEIKEANVIAEELGKAPLAKETYGNFMRSWGSFIGRDIANRHPNTKKIQDAIHDTGTFAREAVEHLSTLFSPLKQVTDLAFRDVGAFHDTASLVSKNGFVVYKVKKKVLKETQNALKEYMSMTDDLFNAAMKRRFVKGTPGKTALALAEYFRTLQKSLGTNGFGKGPTTSVVINNTMHNMYQGFMDIGNSLGKSDKDIYDAIRSFEAGLESSNILKPMTSGTLLKESPDERKSLIGKGYEGGNNQLVGEDHYTSFGFKTAEDQLIDDATKEFNNIFNTGLSREDFLGINQGWLGYKRQSKWRTYVSQVINGFAGIPGAQTAKFLLQSGGTILSSVMGAGGYISLIYGLQKNVSMEELTATKALRKQIDILTDTSDAGDLRGVFDNLLQLDDYADYKIYLDIVNGKPISAWDKITRAAKNISDRKLNNIITSPSRRTAKVFLQNGNNVLDFIFIGELKNIAAADAIRHNNFRTFDSVGDFSEWFKKAPKNQKDKAIAEIRKQASINYGDISGTNFTTSENIVNPFTGVKGSVTDALLGLRSNMSYLNGWGRTRNRNFMRVIAQTGALIRKAGTGGIDDAIEFVAKTPEYRMFMHTLANDINNIIRYVRINDDDEEITFRDFYNAMNVVSQAFQAGSIPGEVRPLTSAVEGLLDGKEGGELYRDFMSETYRALFSNLRVPGETLSMYKAMLKGGVTNPREGIAYYLENKGGIGMLRYIYGAYNKGGKVLMPSSYFGDRGLFGEPVHDPYSQLSYDLQRDASWSTDSIVDKIPNLSRFARFFTGSKKNDSAGKDIILTQADHAKIRDSVLNTATGKEVEEKGYTLLRGTNDVGNFEYEFVKKNLYTMSATDMLKYVDSWKDGLEPKGDMERGIHAFFDALATEEELESGDRNYKQLDIFTNTIRKYKESLKGKKGSKDKVNFAMRNIISSVVKDNQGSEYAAVWGVMEDIANDINGFKGSYGERVGLYNTMIPKIAIQAPISNNRFITTMLGKRHMDEINGSVGKDVIQKKQSGSNIWYNMDYKAKEGVQQMIDMRVAMNEGDLDKAIALTNVIGSYLYGDTTEEKIGNIVAINSFINTIQTSPYIDDNQRDYILFNLIDKNKNTILNYIGDVDIEDKKDISKLVKDYYNNFYVIEERLDQAKLKDWDKIIDDIRSGSSKKSLRKKKVRKGRKGIGGSKGGKGGTPKLPKINIGDIGNLKSKVSFALDKVRGKYPPNRMAEFKIVEVKDNFYQKQAKQRHPMRISAKTKTPAGFSRTSLKPRKDIKRNIKIKKRLKLPKTL